MCWDGGRKTYCGWILWGERWEERHSANWMAWLGSLAMEVVIERARD